MREWLVRGAVDRRHTGRYEKSVVSTDYYNSVRVRILHGSVENDGLRDELLLSSAPENRVVGLAIILPKAHPAAAAFHQFEDELIIVVHIFCR